MNKKRKIEVENSSQVKEEKNLNFMKMFKWMGGLIVGLMVVAYLVASYSSKRFKPSKISIEKAYQKSDSMTNAKAIEEQNDSLKNK